MDIVEPDGGVLPDAPPLIGASPPPEQKVKKTILDEEDDYIEDDAAEDDEEDEDEAEWVPPPKSKPVPHRNYSGMSVEVVVPAPPVSKSKSKPRPVDIESDTEEDTESSRQSAAVPPSPTKRTGTPIKSAKPSAIPRHAVFLSQDDSLDEPAIVPKRKVRDGSAAAAGRAYVPDVGEPGAVKKKKRCDCVLA